MYICMHVPMYVYMYRVMIGGKGVIICVWPTSELDNTWGWLGCLGNHMDMRYMKFDTHVIILVFRFKALKI